MSYEKNAKVEIFGRGMELAVGTLEEEHVQKMLEKRDDFGSAEFLLETTDGIFEFGDQIDDICHIDTLFADEYHLKIAGYVHGNKKKKKPKSVDKESQIGTEITPGGTINACDFPGVFEPQNKNDPLNLNPYYNLIKTARPMIDLNDVKYMFMFISIWKGYFGSIILPADFDPAKLFAIEDTVVYANQTFCLLYAFAYDGQLVFIDDGDCGYIGKSDEHYLFDVQEGRMLLE